MTRIVRFEEIDGDLVLRVPADVAARLNLSAGEPVRLSDVDRSLTIEPLDDETTRQWSIALNILDEEDEVLTALAR